MSRPSTFNQCMPRIEAAFIALTKKYFVRQKECRKRSPSSIGLLFQLLSASMELIMFERRLRRIIASYQKCLEQFPPADSTEALKRMETLSYIIRTIEEIRDAIGNGAGTSMESAYMSRVFSTRDDLVNIWDAYSDMTNADLISRIKDISVNYLPQNESPHE